MTFGVASSLFVVKKVLYFLQVKLPEGTGIVSPYQKPLLLFSKLISNHSRKGDWILDATVGTGVLDMCKQTLS